MGFLEELDQEMRQQPKPKINPGCLLISSALASLVFWSLIINAGNRYWAIIVGAVIFSILTLVGVVKQIKEIKNLFK